MADIFAAIAHSLALVLSTTDFLAGVILGFATITAFLFAFLVALSIARVQINGAILIVLVAIPMVFVGAVQWWPPWAVLLVLILTTTTYTLGRTHGGSEE